jgi:hypothetical protein
VASKERKVFVQSTLLFPAIGKGPELRALLEERTRQQQSQGQRVGLQVIIYGPNTPAFRVARQFEDLGSLEAFRQQAVQPDSRLPALFRQPARNALWEQLLANQPGGGEPPRYIQRFVSMPLPGKGPELAAIIMDRARRAQAEGGRSQVLVQVAGAAAGAVMNQNLFGGLVELEKRRANFQTNPASQESLAKQSGLMAAPSNSAISEVIVPLRPR